MARGGKRPNAGRPRKQGPQNVAFEDARPSYDRPQVWIGTLDARKELTTGDRMELLKNARWAVSNHPYAARIIRGIARFAVGNGLVPQAKTSDSTWNKQAEQLFEDQCCTDPFAFDKSATLNFYTAQAAILEQVACDGDFFSQLTTSADGRAMARFISAECVGDNTFQMDEGWHDGVLVNADNRPIAYRVLKDPATTNGEYTDVPADDIQHFRRIHRFGFLRGVSWLCSSVNRLQDWREAITNELLSAKLNSKIALTIESQDAANIGLGAKLVKRESDTGDRQNFDQLGRGIITAQLRPGERMNAHSFDRPNANFEPFINFLAREIAWGVGVSPELIWTIAGVGGTATRYVLQDAECFFGELRQMLEYQFCRRFWRYWVWHAVQRGDLKNPGSDWWRVEFIPPQRLTVDTGRDGKLRLDLVRSGLLSRKRYFNELGQDSDNEMDDIIRDAAKRKKRIQEIASEEGVELNEQEVFPPAPGGAPIMINEPQNDSSTQD